jgi:hypothetical protein
MPSPRRPPDEECSMSHEPQKPAVENPLALVLTGDRAAAVRWEAAVRRYDHAGLEGLADELVADPAAALEEIASATCAEADLSRYNGKNDSTPDPGDPGDPNERTKRFDDRRSQKNRRPQNRETPAWLARGFQGDAWECRPKIR